MVTMDFITSLPQRYSKNVLMVCCDKFGKFTCLVQAWVVENNLATPEVAKLFFANWVQYYGVPIWLVHDCDVHFTASFWCALWTMLGMQTLLSSAYHP